VENHGRFPRSASCNRHWLIARSGGPHFGSQARARRATQRRGTDPSSIDQPPPRRVVRDSSRSPRIALGRQIARERCVHDQTMGWWFEAVAPIRNDLWWACASQNCGKPVIFAAKLPTPYARRGSGCRGKRPEVAISKELGRTLPR
jgi:hypothetical protein